MLSHSDEILRKTFYYSAQALESNKKSRAEQGKHRRQHDKLWFLSIKLFIQALWGAVRKNIISDRFSTKTAISAHI